MWKGPLCVFTLSENKRKSNLTFWACRLLSSVWMHLCGSCFGTFYEDVSHIITAMNNNTNLIAHSISGREAVTLAAADLWLYLLLMEYLQWGKHRGVRDTLARFHPLCVGTSRSEQPCVKGPFIGSVLRTWKRDSSPVCINLTEWTAMRKGSLTLIERRKWM